MQLMLSDSDDEGLFGILVPAINGDGILAVRRNINGDVDDGNC